VYLPFNSDYGFLFRRQKRPKPGKKVDLTRKGNPVYEDLLRQYNVKGVPTVVFLDSQGNERRTLRLVDFLPADQFLVRVAEIRKLP
jgi:thiol:disulfide interchange protein DsbD